MRRLVLILVALVLAGCTPKPPVRERSEPPPPPPAEEASPLAARVNEALRLAGEGAYPEAILQLQKALDEDPRLAEAWYNLGVLYRRIGQSLDAENSLARAVKLEGGRGDYLYAHGAALYDLELWKDAQRQFERSFRADGNLRALFSLGQTLERRGKLEKALGAYREYLRRDPDSVWGRRAAERLEELAVSLDRR